MCVLFLFHRQHWSLEFSTQPDILSSTNSRRTTAVMASSEGSSSNDSLSRVAWKSLVRRSLEAWDAPDRPNIMGMNAESSLKRYVDLDDFLNRSGQMSQMVFWFFQRRDAFLSQKTMTKWSRNRLDDYILLPASNGFATRAECFFVSHFWHSHNDPDPGGKYLRRLQIELGLQTWSYVWVDWTCLPQNPRCDTEETYFLRALRTMPAIIRNCGFAWHYPPFEPRLWILYEVAVYTLTCTDDPPPLHDNKQFLDHVKEMREVGVRATLSKHGYRCTIERDKGFITAWLELLILLRRLLVDIGDVKHILHKIGDVRDILDKLTWMPIAGNIWINTLSGQVKLQPFKGALTLGGEQYTFTPFPKWVSFHGPGLGLFY